MARAFSRRDAPRVADLSHEVVRLLEDLIVFTGVTFGQSAGTEVAVRVEIESKFAACF